MTTLVFAAPKTIEQLAAEFNPDSFRGMRFMCIKTRNAVAKLLKAKGIPHRKACSGMQQLHPQYIADYVGEYEIGFGNTDYQQMHRIYTIEKAW